MNHPLTTRRLLSLARALMTVVATLLGQAYAHGLDRAPILPKTQAAPAPSPLPPELPPVADDLAAATDDALLEAFEAHLTVEGRSRPDGGLRGRLSALLRAGRRGPMNVESDGQGPTLVRRTQQAPKGP